MFLKVRTPAKVNLTLDVLGLRADGYHEISSIMQTVSLYDYLTFELEESNTLEIILDGSSKIIPYDGKNLVYKAITKLYSLVKDVKPYKIKVYIEKNIPSEAGLGGGSSDAAATIWALNRLLNLNLSEKMLNTLCASLGSDLNVCFWGGASLATSRGEVVERVAVKEYPLTIIKPIGFGISAKEGYQMFDALNYETISNSTSLFLKALENNEDISPYLHNDLGIVPMEKFEVLKKIKNVYPNSVMTGSGSACYVLGDVFENKLPQTGYEVYPNLRFVSSGIEIV